VFAVETPGDFAQHFILFLPTRFQFPGEDFLKMVAVIDGGVKEHNVRGLFGSG